MRTGRWIIPIWLILVMAFWPGCDESEAPVHWTTAREILSGKIDRPQPLPDRIPSKRDELTSPTPSRATLKGKVPTEQQLARLIQPKGDFSVKGLVTMIDIGSHNCPPCRWMAPILEEVKEEYAGKAAIVYIDLDLNPALGKKYQVRALPTQVFYDRDGREVFRHIGFMDKEYIETVLSHLGVE